MRYTTSSSTSQPAIKPPIHLTTSGKQLPSKPSTLDRRRTRSHIKRLQDLYPDPFISWVDPGLCYSPKKKKIEPRYSPAYPPGFLGEKSSVFGEELGLDLGEAAISEEEKYMTSHIERNFDGVKIIWARKDWEENMEKVLRGEEVVREKRRKGRRERERKGGLSAAQRKRKWKLSRAGAIKTEESEGEVKVEKELEEGRRKDKGTTTRG
jgi:hypothetical protein